MERPTGRRDHPGLCVRTKLLPGLGQPLSRAFPIGAWPAFEELEFRDHHRPFGFASGVQTGKSFGEYEALVKGPLFMGKGITHLLAAEHPQFSRD